jgi:O-antigen ligase
VALAAAAAVTLIPALVVRGKLGVFTRVASIALILAAGAFILANPFVQERLNSDEAGESDATRSTLFDLTFYTASQYNWLGSGPNTSAEAVRPYNVNYALVESGYLQLLVSVGIPGLILFFLVLAVSGVLALKRGLFGAAGLLTGYAVAIAFFNVLESNPPTLVLIGFSLVTVWGSASGSESRRLAGTALKRARGDLVRPPTVLLLNR